MAYNHKVMPAARDGTKTMVRLLHDMQWGCMYGSMMCNNEDTTKQGRMYGGAAQ